MLISINTRPSTHLRYEYIRRDFGHNGKRDQLQEALEFEKEVLCAGLAYIHGSCPTNETKVTSSNPTQYRARLGSKVIKNFYPVFNSSYAFKSLNSPIT